MKGAYKEGKDLYATIATGVYHNTYWDNMEHHEDGSPNPEGKKRRGNCKQVLLGISYGLTVPSMAERMSLTVKEAQKVMDDFYVAFPQVKSWQDKTIADAINEGYVEDIWGRRRRLPKIQLPKYEVVEMHPKIAFNPFINCEDKTIESPAVKKYQKMLAEDLKLTGYKQKDSIRDTIERATREGIKIIDNSGTLAHAKNQCVNARIQGSAATMTKKAMIAIYNDETLKKLDFNLLIGVHDELIGECPKENAEQVAKRLCDIMINIVADDVDVPFKSDAEISQCWYYSDYVATVKEEFTDYMKMGLGRDESLRKIYKGHHEWTEQQLNAILIV